MGKYYCSITGCHNYSGRYGKFCKEVTLHKLPKDKSTRQAWIRCISRKNWRPTSYTRVCSDHFRYGVGPNSVDRNKVPCEHLPQKKTVERNARSHPRDRTSTDTTATASCHINQHHSYAKPEDDSTAEEGSNRARNDQQTQTSDKPSASVETEATMAEITIEDIKHSDDKVAFYTGLPDFKTFDSLFQSLMEQGADKLSTEIIGSVNQYKLGRRRKLRRVNEFLLVMMRLRLGLLVRDLEYRFKISASSVSKIFNAWILFMRECMQSLVYMPSLDVLKLHVPICFEKFSDTRVVLDCTELFIQSPSSLQNKSLTYSNYKSHNTFKALVGVSMTGATVLVSSLWPGSTSDVQITRECGLLEQLKRGDAVMVDKGFIHIHSDLRPKGVKLYCPPFKTKTQFSKTEVECTRRIASARIHVERKMEQIKNFRILQGVIPLAISEYADHIFFVCAALTNLLPPLVS